MKTFVKNFMTIYWRKRKKCDKIAECIGMDDKGGTIMEPIYLSIQQQATGNRIRELLKENGYTVKDIQKVMGFENPQAVYKWISGRSLPSLDNFLILSRVLHTSIEDILVIDEDIVFLSFLLDIQTKYNQIDRNQ